MGGGGAAVVAIVVIILLRLNLLKLAIIPVGFCLSALDFDTFLGRV